MARSLIEAGHDPSKLRSSPGHPGVVRSDAAPETTVERCHQREEPRPKTLEDANVRLGSVLSDVFGVSGQRMLEALLDGRGNPQELAEMARQKAREKIPQIIESFAGHRFSEHHRLMIRMSLEHLRMLEKQIIAIDEEVIQRIQFLGLERMLNLLAAIPGLGHDSAVAILAEVGPDMKQFPTGKQLSSWAGVCPGNKKTAGKNFSGHTTRGHRWLRSTLTECAWAVSRAKKSTLRDKFWRWAAGSKKAVVAVDTRTPAAGISGFADPATTGAGAIATGGQTA